MAVFFCANEYCLTQKVMFSGEILSWSSCLLGLRKLLPHAPPSVEMALDPRHRSAMPHRDTDVEQKTEKPKFQPGDTNSRPVISTQKKIRSPQKTNKDGISDDFGINAFTTRHPFLGTRVLGFSIGRGLGAIKGFGV